jgi:hypothetical protein
MPDEFKLNGHDEEGDAAIGDTETQAQLQAVKLKLGDLTRADSPILSFSKQELGLLHKLITAPDKSDDFTKIVEICDFLSEDEANDELFAFYEAVRLGMDTAFNIAHALSRSSINRKGGHRSSRAAMLMDTLSHQKFTSNAPRSKGSGNTNPRSPIS